MTSPIINKYTKLKAKKQMNVIPIIADAFIAEIFCKHFDEIPKKMLKHLAMVVDYELVNERYIVDNNEIRSVIKWDRMGKMKLVRTLIRCLDQDIDVIDKIKPELKKFEYKIKNLIYLLRRRPRYIEHFPVDLNKIKTIEAVGLMSIGETYFLDKIDLSKYKFNFKESMKIIKGYKYDRKIIEQVNYESLNGYQIAEIMIHTGNKNIDLLDISKLTNIDWINLLEYKPELLNYCDYNKFMNGDIFYLIKLCCMFETPNLYHLILKRDLKEISPFGWEKLLTENPNEFIDHCDFGKLNENNWKVILNTNPELVAYKS